MKKLILFALVCVGCTSSGSNRSPGPQPESLAKERVATRLEAARADQAAGRADGVTVTAMATTTYWLGLKAAIHPRPIDPGTVAKAIGRLPTAGVDPDLVREGQFVAEEMRAAAASIGSMPAVTILFRVPASRWLEAETLSRHAIEQCRAVERLRPDLTARYGIEFSTLDVPNP